MVSKVLVTQQLSVQVCQPLHATQYYKEALQLFYHQSILLYILHQCLDTNR